MTDSQVTELEKLTTDELEEIVHGGDNLHIPNSYASTAKRILDTRRHEELLEATKKQNQIDEIDKLSDLKIFYSWQSDLPNKANRSFIEESLKLAVKNIGQDDSIKIVPRVDKDTKDIPGSPNIAKTILEKIDHSFLIVSDVTIVNNTSPKRLTPNPNVLFELGYAVKSLGLDNIIMVQNIAYGNPDRLPFDLRMHRILSYKFSVGDINATTIKKKLSKDLENAIRLSLKVIQDKPIVKKNSEIEELINLLGTNQPILIIENKLKLLVNKTLSDLKLTNIYKYNDPVSAEEFISRKNKIETIFKELVEIFVNIGRWADKLQLTAIVRQYKRIILIPEPDGSYNETWLGIARYPSLLLMYALGLGAIYNENVEVLKTLFGLEIYNRHTNKNEPLSIQTSVFSVFRRYQDMTKDKRYYPGSDEMFSFFRPYFSEISDNEFEDIFDSFEYFLSLVYCSWEVKNNILDGWVPQGSFMWRTGRRKIWDVISDKFNKKGVDWIFFPCFELAKENMSQVFKITNEFVSKHSVGLW